MTVWLWIGFVGIVLGLLAFDLCVLNRKAHVISTREALCWTAGYVTLALSFTLVVYLLYEGHLFGIGMQGAKKLSGKEAAILYLTGYIIEESLSLDNMFVIAMIFAYFRVPAMYQHRTLFWGIMGALVLRGVMILAGTALIQRFDWIIYVFGGLLILSAIKMLRMKDEKIEPEKNPFVRLVRRFYPVSKDFEGQKFFTRVDGRRAITPMFLVLLVVETSDVVFAVDSIPAIFAVTTDPFIVFTSNVFAILGLRSLFFVLAGMMRKFQYLNYSLVCVLAYVGTKMLLSHHYHIPALISLGVVLGLLGIGIVASIIVSRKEAAQMAAPAMEALGDAAMYAVRKVRRIVVLVVGCTVVLIGIAMIALPGPAIVVIPLGLAILATEFVWARRLLQRVKKNAMELKAGLMGKTGPPKQDPPQP